MGGQCLPPFQSGKKSETFSEMFILKYKKERVKMIFERMELKWWSIKNGFPLALLFFSPFSELSV